MDTKVIYKIELFFIIIALIMLSCNNSSKSDNKIEYYGPNDLWDEILAEFSVELPEYQIFNKGEVIIKDDVIKLNFQIQEEEIQLEVQNENVSLWLSDKKIDSEKLMLSSRNLDGIAGYKVRHNRDSLIVLEYLSLGAIGRGANRVMYFVIDSNFNNYLLSSYNGRIVCFSDLDGDGKIDFLEIEDTLFYAKPPFEENYTEVYFFNLIKLMNSKAIKVNSRFNDLALIKCNNNFIQTTKEEVSKMVINPCKENK